MMIEQQLYDSPCFIVSGSTNAGFSVNGATGCAIRRQNGHHLLRDRNHSVTTELDQLRGEFKGSGSGKKFFAHTSFSSVRTVHIVPRHTSSFSSPSGPDQFTLFRLSKCLTAGALTFSDDGCVWEMVPNPSRESLHSDRARAVVTYTENYIPSVPNSDLWKQRVKIISKIRKKKTVFPLDTTLRRFMSLMNLARRTFRAPTAYVLLFVFTGATKAPGWEK